MTRMQSSPMDTQSFQMNTYVVRMQSSQMGTQSSQMDTYVYVCSEIAKHFSKNIQNLPVTIAILRVIL